MEKREWIFRTTQYFLSSHCVLGCILNSGIQPSTHRQMVPAFMELRFCKQRQLMNKSTNNYFFHSSQGCGEKEGRVRGSRTVWVVRKELSAEDSFRRGLSRGKGGPWEDGRRASVWKGVTLLSPARQPVGHQVLTSVLMSPSLPPSLSPSHSPSHSLSPLFIFTSLLCSCRFKKKKNFLGS